MNEENQGQNTSGEQSQEPPLAATHINSQNEKPKKSKTMLWVAVSIIILVILAAIVIAFVLLSQNKKQENNTQTQTTGSENATGFGNQKKSVHFESSTPAHGTTLAGAPNQVVVDFNFDLAKPSSISVTSNGKEYASGDTTIDDNLISMRRNMDVNAPDGIYMVNYKGCWPDKSCHDGNFSFKIDRTKASSYTDLRGKKEVTIDMESIKFKPENVIIDKGTKVTWINKEGVAHYVNTDPHAAHTHLLDFNSKALNNGGKYSYTFDKAGAYPYHCSAHASQMTGNILVED